VEADTFRSARIYGISKIMAKSITAKPKKRGRPSTGGRDPMIGARFPAALTEAIDKWGASNGEIGRSEAMRQLVELGLKAKGKGAIGGSGK
jgi:hypothetical protein